MRGLSGGPYQQAAHAQDRGLPRRGVPFHVEHCHVSGTLRRPHAGLRPKRNSRTCLYSKPDGACRAGRNRPFSAGRNVASRLDTRAHGMCRSGRNRSAWGAGHVPTPWQPSYEDGTGRGGEPASYHAMATLRPGRNPGMATQQSVRDGTNDRVRPSGTEPYVRWGRNSTFCPGRRNPAETEHPDPAWPPPKVTPQKKPISILSQKI
jgi:hypothetical protein